MAQKKNSPAEDRSKIIKIGSSRKPDGKEISTVCRNIKKYREACGIEQKELARRLGVIPSNVSNWELGIARPNPDLFYAICTALGITLYELFDIDDPMLRFTAREQTLLQKYRDLSEGHKYAVDRLVEALSVSEVMEDKPEITELIYFSKTLAAGVGDPLEFEDEGEPIFLYSSDVVNEADYVFSVSGDSMEPAYHNEDMVLVKSNANCSIKYGDVCEFIDGNRTYIKEYQKDGLHSFNEKYKPMHFTEDDCVICIGKVIGVLDQDADIARQKDVERYLAEREV